MASSPPYPGYLSPAQIQAQAATQANASLDPERQDLRQQQADAAAANQQTGQAIIGLSQALAETLGGIAPAIEGTYRAGAVDTAAFGKGFSDTMKALQDQNAGQVNDLLGKLGAPEGQMLHPTSAGADFLYGLGGYLPAANMEREGAAFTSAAKFLPATALLQGQRDFAVNIATGKKEQKDFERALRGIDQKYPGLLQSIVSSMNGDQLQRFAAQLQAKVLGLNIGKATGVYQGDTLPGYYTDPDTGQTLKVGTHVDPKTGRVVKDAAPGKRGAKAAARNTALSAFENALPGAADTLYTGKQVENPNFNPYLPEGPGNEKNTVQRVDGWIAYQRLWNQYAPGLIRAGVKRATIAKQIKAALRSVGYTGSFSAPRSGSFVQRPDDRAGRRGP